MKLNITYRHFDSTPSIEAKIKEKAKHFEKYFKNKAKVEWVCSIDGPIHQSEVHIHADHSLFHAKATDTNLYKTFDEVVAKIERQMRKKNTHIKDKIHSHQSKPQFL